jgi:ABC-type nitrate/sulfonate/bicarbonate transport system substrate-binding protein
MPNLILDISLLYKTCVAGPLSDSFERPLAGWRGHPTMINTGSRLVFRLAALIALWLSLGSGACARRDAATHGKDSTNAEFETLELRYQGFSGQVTFPELAEDLGYLAPLTLKYVGATISGPQDIQTVMTRDVDFGGAFNGAVLKLFASQAPVQAVVGFYGVDQQTWGGFFVLQGSPIRSARDLIGKKVAVNTLGAHHEFVLREYLARNGLSKDEAAQVTLLVVPPLNAEQALRQGQVEVAVLQGILRDKAQERGGLRSLFSDYDLFGEFTAGSYVMTRDFLRTHPRAARQFVQATARAIEWARAQPRADVVARFEGIIARRGRPEDASNVKYWRSTGVAGQGGLISDREFGLWIDWLVKDGQLSQGQIQPKDVYTNELNPYLKSAS